LALALDDEVDVACRSPERGRRLPRLDVVDRDRSAERHVEMRVRVDAAGKDVLPGCIDHLVCLDVEALADQRDALVLDEDVRDVVVPAVTIRPPLISTDIPVLLTCLPATPGR